MEEASFTKEILISGVVQISKANYAQKGFYFQSFTSLATGLERIGKLCLLLDYYINNNGVFPDIKFIKNQINHDLKLLYDKSRELTNAHSIKFKYLDNLDDEIHENMISILSAFAKGDRYSNIDFLVTSKTKSDPILEWHLKVDEILFEKKVSKKGKKKIHLNAMLIEQLIGSHSSVRHFSESRKELTNLYGSSFLTGMNESIVRFRQFHILQIIRYWFEILWTLQYRAMSLGREEIPFFNELFAEFYNSDEFFLKTKDYK